jgi:hypothetical protein
MKHQQSHKEQSMMEKHELKTFMEELELANDSLTKDKGSLENELHNMIRKLEDLRTDVKR